MLAYDTLMALPPRENTAAHSVRDTILYALGVGVGAADPLDPAALRYIYEEQLQALPTMALVLAYPGFYLKEPQYKMDWVKILHGEQRLTLHRQIPVAGSIRSVLRFDEVYDKGPGKGALLFATRELFDLVTGELLVTLGSTSFLRGDGGCGGRTDAAPAPAKIPARDPDVILDTPTRRDQALLYRLSGDMNPLHADPMLANRAGFKRPILHGMCTFGIVGRVALQLLCADQPANFKQFDARFSSPVYPGETIRTEIWHLASGQAAIRSRVTERDVVVLNNGFVRFEKG